MERISSYNLLAHIVTVFLTVKVLIFPKHLSFGVGKGIYSGYINHESELCFTPILPQSRIREMERKERDKVHETKYPLNSPQQMEVEAKQEMRASHDSIVGTYE